MNKKKIKDIARVGSGQGAPQDPSDFSDEGSPFIRAGSLEKLLSGVNENSLEKIQSNTANKYKLKLYPPGTVIFAKSGMSATKNRIYKLINSCYVVNHLATLEPYGNIHPDYLVISLRRTPPSRLIKDLAYPSIDQPSIENFKIIVPDKIEDQIRIATLMAQSEELLAKRKESIHLLDELLKSTFLEMFGSNYIQDKKWDIINLGGVIDTLTDYHANGSYETLRDHVTLKNELDFAIMVRTTDLEKNKFDDDCIYIDEKAYHFLEKTKIYGGEIIINKIGSAGKVYLMPKLDRPASLGMNAFMLRFSKSVNNIFIYYLLSSNFGQSSINKNIKGAVTKTITKDAIRKIKIPKPPIDLQNQFAQIVEKVESLKTKYEASLKELENLYGSLTQRAFRGELDLSKINIDNELLAHSLKIDEGGEAPIAKGKKHKQKLGKIDAERNPFEKLYLEDNANKIKEQFEFYDFTFNDFAAFLTRETNAAVCLSSEEQKKEGIEKVEDIRTFVFDCIEDRNPFLKIKQLYFDALEDINKWPVRTKQTKDEILSKIENGELKQEDLSGIYFRIIK
jgi:type I restriction enzyme, S subunit